MKFINLFIILCMVVQTTNAQDILIRKKGQDSVHTYRIPALCTTNKGTLIAAYDCRYENSRDLQGDIDVGISRSIDQGETWKPMKIVLNMGQWGDLPEKFNGVSDPCFLVDTVNGRIWVAALWMHGVLDKTGKFINGLNKDSTAWQHQWSGRGSQSGYSPYQTSQYIMAYSDDDGLSWSEPINITKSKPEKWWLYAPAPGQGIIAKNDTLIMPTQGRDENGVPFSNITYSIDRGKTWITTNPATYNTSECAVVELSDGSIMLNIRDNRNRDEKDEKNGRAIFVTKDLGVSWTEHPTSHSALKEPVCMASIHRHGKTLYFCNPASTTERNNITIKKSLDDGKTWSEGLLIDPRDGYGYSCITSIDSNHIGVIWEGFGDLYFRKIRINTVK